MHDMQSFAGQWIEIEMSGPKRIVGVLCDVGSDLLVVHSEQQFYYIPFVHVQQWKRCAAPPPDSRPSEPGEVPLPFSQEAISYRKMLMNAKGRFVEMYVTGCHSLHGYLTSIMNNYFVFYSPVHKTVYISLDHLKWLVPYPQHLTPYSCCPKDLHAHPAPLSLSRTFEEQCRKLKGQLVMFDLGDDPDKIGLLLGVEENRAELVIANCEKRYWNLRHLKTVQVP